MAALTLSRLFCVLSLLTINGFNIDRWKTYSFTEEHYTIDFPDTPVGSQQEIASPMGPLLMKIQLLDYTMDENAEIFSYMSSHTVYPDSTITSDNEDFISNFFKGTIQDAVMHTKGTLLSENNNPIDGFPGKDVKILYADNLAILHMRIYLVKNASYIVQTITIPEKQDIESVDRFLNSFTLLK